ncbi:MAG: histidine triad nucleotide-binding protein [Candidatus Ryanbacteria bacterium CG10_big_fil_rev_8_21_14_0_10_43_42]|uniref:Histidine triad nucleotide-binding protein n=1 Tax=Candidatus Ryanbacteria bacterium CG10_big_fil_rev_8_21_14_0_10_43_42 TaxID=1974864 RepID=A0A2M8KXA9_9BACT|nr:MAG: histidine triad nucleotide-binding protein [Candidatus Ryanbacteria bacterium CG10_big_fil_rev_8_21_14_0_10_43_42]
MEDCIFCKITKKEAPAEILTETDNLVVFKDIKPSAPVHLLIVPKKHVVSIAELKAEDRGLVTDMIYMGKDMAVKEALSGYRLSFNVGRGGGQLVDHLHLHLLGGWNQ